MVATYTQVQLNAPITQASFAAAITSIVEGLGGSPYDSWTTSNQNLVFQFVEDSNTKGDLYLYFAINGSANQVYYSIYDSWNKTNHSGTNGATALLIGPTSSTVITFNIINHPELKGFFYGQVSNSYNGTFVGFLRPANIPSWYNETSWMYAFMPTSNAANNLNSWQCSSSNGFGVSTGFYFMLPSSGSFSYANSNNNNLLALNQSLLLCQPTSGGTQSGEAGITSSDFAFAACSNKNQFDILSYNNGAEEFLVLNAGSPGLLIRTQ